MEESVKMETTTSKEKYRYYVILSGGKNLKLILKHIIFVKL